MTESNQLDFIATPESRSSVTPTRVCPICGAGRMIVIEQIPPNTMAQGAMAGANRCLTFDSS